MTRPQQTNAELIKATRKAALAAFEDYVHLREISSQITTSPVQLRHASAILRRWIVEGAIQRVANPRVGKLKVYAIDNNPIYRAARNGKVDFFITGGAALHGVYISSLGSFQCNEPYHPDTHQLFNVDTFAKQNVIYINGKWITRSQIIKYVANVADGVHSGQVRDDVDALLSQVTHTLSINMIIDENGIEMPQIRIFHDVGKYVEPETIYDPTEINGVLLELLSSVHFLTSSPDVRNLMQKIELELRQSS